MFKKGKGGKKKTKITGKKVIAGVTAIVLLGAAGTVVYSKVQTSHSVQSETKEVRSAEVQKGKISNTIVGTGNLELDEAKDVTVPEGLTVKEVFVESGDHVSAGTVLATVDSSSVLEAVENVQSELTELDEKISTCQEDDEENTIESPAAGTSSTGTTGSTGVSQMSYTRSVTTGNTGAVLQKLSFEEFEDEETEAEVQGFSDTENVSVDSDSDIDISTDTKIVFSVVNDDTSDSTQAVVTAPVKGAVPVTEISTSDGSYSGVITWNPNDTAFAADTAYQALVMLSASDGYCFGTDSIQGTASGVISGITVSDNGKTLEFQLVFPKTEADENNDAKSDDDSAKDNNNADTNTDNNQNTDNNRNTNSSNNTNSDNSTAGSEQTGTGSQNGGSAQSGTGTSETGNSGGAGQSGTGSVTGGTSGGTAAQQNTTASAAEESSSGQETTDSYSTDVTAFTISSDENMCLSVSVDELDINSVELGQTAEITFDAIEDKTFEGEVTKIGNSASVSGGVAKYTVEIKVPKDDQMKQGMNASATITIEEKDQILTLPMNALQEQGDRTFVYTEKSEDGTPSGEVEIETGLTDGNTVEITSGLGEGETVYYMRSDGNSTGSSNSGMPDMGGDEKNSMGGNMPGGGDFSGNSSGGPGM